MKKILYVLSFLIIALVIGWASYISSYTFQAVNNVAPQKVEKETKDLFTEYTGIDIEEKETAPDGTVKRYYEDGRLKLEGKIVNGKMEGAWTRYTYGKLDGENIRLEEKWFYKNDRVERMNRVVRCSNHKVVTSGEDILYKNDKVYKSSSCSVDKCEDAFTVHLAVFKALCRFKNVAKLYNISFYESFDLNGISKRNNLSLSLTKSYYDDYDNRYKRTNHRIYENEWETSYSHGYYISPKNHGFIFHYYNYNQNEYHQASFKAINGRELRDQLKISYNTDNKSRGRGLTKESINYWWDNGEERFSVQKRKNYYNYSSERIINKYYNGHKIKYERIWRDSHETSRGLYDDKYNLIVNFRNGKIDFLASPKRNTN